MATGNTSKIRIPLQRVDGNITVASYSRYRFSPFGQEIKIFFFCCLLLIAVVGATSNSILLLAINQLSAQNRRKARSGTSPIMLGQTLIQIKRHLAIINLLTALLVAPLHTAQLFADMYSTTWSCRATRLPVHAMGSITVLNLLLLGIERYCAIFHPFFIPSESMIKVCFLGIWLGGGLLGFLQVLQLDAIPVVTSQTEYTISCQPIMDTLFKKCLSTSFLVIIIPCIAFLFITIRTTKYLSDRRKKVESGKGVYLHKIHAWRIKETKVCVCIILTFIVPYVFYVVNIIMRPNFSICIDYCMRRTQDTLVLLNCVITPLVTMYGGRLFREMAMKRINMILRRLMNQETAHLQTTKTQTVETAL